MDLFSVWLWVCRRLSVFFKYSNSSVAAAMCFILSCKSYRIIFVTHPYLHVILCFLTRYPLLLSRIRRATPRWHEDREDLKLAQRKVEEQIAKLNSVII